MLKTFQFLFLKKKENTSLSSHLKHLKIVFDLNAEKLANNLNIIKLNGLNIS